MKQQQLQRLQSNPIQESKEKKEKKKRKLRNEPFESSAKMAMSATVLQATLKLHFLSDIVFSIPVMVWVGTLTNGWISG